MQSVKDYLGFVAKDWVEGGAHPEYTSQDQWFTYLVLANLCEKIYDPNFSKLKPDEEIDFGDFKQMGDVWKNSKITPLLHDPKMVSLNRAPDQEDSEIRDSSGLHIGWSLVEGHIFNTPACIIVFKGTNTALDLLIDLALYESKDEHMSFHGGMYKALKLYEDKIIASLRDYCSKGHCKRIFITGHSLGGGYAKLLSLSPRFNQEILSAFDCVEVVAFGSPMVVLGDCKLDYPHVDTTMIFAHDNDLVTKLPKYTKSLIEQIQTHYKSITDLLPIGTLGESYLQGVLSKLLGLKDQVLAHCEKFQPYGQYHFVTNNSHKLDPKNLSLFHLNYLSNPLSYHKMINYADNMMSLMEKKFPMFVEDYLQARLPNPLPIDDYTLVYRGVNGKNGFHGGNGHYRVAKLNPGESGIDGETAQDGTDEICFCGMII
jgi:hypothetical protein